MGMRKAYKGPPPCRELVLGVFWSQRIWAFPLVGWVTGRINLSEPVSLYMMGDNYFLPQRIIEE